MKKIQARSEQADHFSATLREALRASRRVAENVIIYLSCFF
jgi:hypothetical protein